VTLQLNFSRLVLRAEEILCTQSIQRTQRLCIQQFPKFQKNWTKSVTPVNIKV